MVGEAAVHAWDWLRSAMVRFFTFSTSLELSGCAGLEIVRRASLKAVIWCWLFLLINRKRSYMPFKTNQIAEVF